MQVAIIVGRVPLSFSSLANYYGDQHQPIKII
jgi:hypothetical protein